MGPDPRFRVERVATLALVAIACAGALYHDRALPAPLGLDAPASVFSEARAAAFASSLDAPRLAGSDAEHAAFEKLERALREVAAETRAASAGRVVVDVLRTKHSGTFPLRGPGVRETREQTMVYDRLDALAARVRVRGSILHARGDASSVSEEARVGAGAKEPSAPRALLFAAHLDTVHVSPGGCDNAANVAIVLETVRAFAAGLSERENDDASAGADANANASSSDPYVTPLMAAFVSAEEDGFAGARGVVRDHPWFKTQVAAFANFEAMGSGGPHRAFRATIGGSSSALLRLYSLGAPRPSGTVVASDVFSSGFVKSDTDFRVFRDDGDVPGIDLAFVEHTRLYHTPRDTVGALTKRRPGSMQASGANALGFARAFAGTFSARAEEKKAAGLGVRPGGVSTTRPSDVRRGASEENGRTVRSKPPLTVWFAFPGLGAFALIDLDGARAATATALAATTSTAMATLSPYGFGAPRASETKDAVALLAAALVGTAGAAVAFVAAPVAGGLAALATASITETPVPWSRSLGAFALCATPPAAAATLGTLDLTRRLVRAVVASGAASSPSRRARRRRREGDISSVAKRRERSNEDALVKLHARADRVALLGAALFLALLASCAFAKDVAGAYLFAVPAFGIFLGAAIAGTETVPQTDRQSPRVWPSFAFAVPLAFAASLAFPTCFALVDLAHGMAPRSRPPPGTSEYLYDIVCGVVAGGAVAVSAFPSLAFFVSTRDPRDDRDSAFHARFSWATVVAATVAIVASLCAAVGAPSFTEDFPQQGSSFAAVTSGNVSDAVLVFLPAGPGSSEDAFARTIESFEPVESFASPRGGGEDVASAEKKYACDGPADRDALRRWDLASYSLSGSGACAARPASLARELAEATAAKAIATELRVRTGAPRAVAGSALAVPITIDLKGMTRWVVAVDSQCAKRIAFAQGQDAAVEDAEAEADERLRAERTRASAERREDTRSDRTADASAAGDDGDVSGKKKRRASPPVGPWRSASNGRAGTGTGTHRYAAFGVGGRDARKHPRPITVWIETRAETDETVRGGSVPEKCARDAVRIRADADFETATVSAARRGSPPWIVRFAKHHTPLKLAVLAVAGLERDERAFPASA